MLSRPNCMELNMVKISILYPNDKAGWFDLGYFVDRHMPLQIELLGSHPGFRGVSVEQGVAGGLAGTAPTYQALSHFTFDTLGDFMDAYMTHAEVLQGDVANYTDIEPVVQVNEVLIS